MKNNRKKTIGVATCLFVLLTSGIFTSAITQSTVVTAMQQDSDTEEVIVQILDDTYTNETVVSLTKQKASELEIVIETVSKKLQNASSQEEIREIYKETLNSFQSLGLFKKGTEKDKILRILERGRLMHSSQDGIQEKHLKINLNALCYIAGDTTNTMFMGIRTHALFWIAYFLDALGRSGNSINALISISWFLDVVKPFSVWHRILLGQFGIPGGISPAAGWIITCGLTGLRGWNGSITGKIMDGSEYIATGVIGFSGIKIIHNYDLRTFYLGSALFISIQQ
jgi:hypothetical protein